MTRLCECLLVSRSGYYAWRKRQPSARDRRHQAMLKVIIKCFQKSQETYGYPRIHADLKALGIHIGRHQVAGIMRKFGLMAKMKRRKSGSARMIRHFSGQANRVGCCPVPGKKQRVWVGDITQINTKEKPFYLATVMDRLSRRLVGSAMSEDRNTALVSRALREAIKQNPKVNVNYFHSDQGVEYASYRYRNLLEQNGIIRSISRRGNCYDNAHMESFFHSLKTEVVYFEDFETMKRGMRKVNAYIKYYNEQRRHSSLGYLSPVQFEKNIN